MLLFQKNVLDTAIRSQHPARCQLGDAIKTCPHLRLRQLASSLELVAVRDTIEAVLIIRRVLAVIDRVEEGHPPHPALHEQLSVVVGIELDSEAGCGAQLIHRAPNLRRVAGRAPLVAMVLVPLVLCSPCTA